MFCPLRVRVKMMIGGKTIKQCLYTLRSPLQFVFHNPNPNSWKLWFIVVFLLDTPPGCWAQSAAPCSLLVTAAFQLKCEISVCLSENLLSWQKKTKRKNYKDETVGLGSICPFCIVMQNGQIEPSTTNNQLLFLFCPLSQKWPASVAPAMLLHLLDTAAHQANAPPIAKATKAARQKQLCTQWKQQLGLRVGERGILPFLAVAPATSQKQKQALRGLSPCFFLISFAVMDKTLKSKQDAWRIVQEGTGKRRHLSSNGFVDFMCFSLGAAARRAGVLSSDHWNFLMSIEQIKHLYIHAWTLSIMKNCEVGFKSAKASFFGWVCEVALNFHSVLQKYKHNHVWTPINSDCANASWS